MKDQSSNENKKENVSLKPKKQKPNFKLLRGDYRRISSADLQACAKKLMELTREYTQIKESDWSKLEKNKKKYTADQSEEKVATGKTKNSKEPTTLKQIIKTKTLLNYLFTSFKYMYDNKIYIKYYRNLVGLSHHNGMSSARRPLKCYLYCMEYLKGLRGFIDYLEKKMNYNYTIKQALVNQTGQKHPGGYRKCSKGRAYTEDRAKYNLVLKIQYGTSK